jgi:GTP cyclohydrolase IA
MTKKNYELGLKIHKILLSKHLENSFIDDAINKWQDEIYIQQLESKFTEFVGLLGLNLADPDLKQTPARVVKFFLQELFYGLDYHNFPDISSNYNKFLYKSPLISKNITVNSTCEHHFVAINGRAVVSYIPDGKIVGLSKLNRIVDFFAHRPQLQERLTQQIFVTLQELLETNNVALAITATHHCIVARGIQDAGNEILTLELGGKFQTDEILKGSFYQLATQVKTTLV